MGDSGAEILAKDLRGSTISKVLDLGQNGITDRGAAALAEGLMGSKVEKLHLGKNAITDDGVASIARALPQSAVVYLSLEHNRDITADGLQSLQDLGCISKLVEDHVGFFLCPRRSRVGGEWLGAASNYTASDYIPRWISPSFHNSSKRADGAQVETHDTRSKQPPSSGAHYDAEMSAAKRPRGRPTATCACFMDIQGPEEDQWTLHKCLLNGPNDAKAPTTRASSEQSFTLHGITVSGQNARASSAVKAHVHAHAFTFEERSQKVGVRSLVDRSASLTPSLKSAVGTVCSVRAFSPMAPPFPGLFLFRAPPPA